MNAPVKFPVRFAFDAVSILLRLHSRNAQRAFLLFRRLVVSLQLHSVSLHFGLLCLHFTL